MTSVAALAEYLFRPKPSLIISRKNALERNLGISGAFFPSKTMASFLNSSDSWTTARGTNLDLRRFWSCAVCSDLPTDFEKLITQATSSFIRIGSERCSAEKNYPRVSGEAFKWRTGIT